MSECENEKYLHRLESYIMDAKINSDTETFLGLITELQRIKEEVCANHSLVQRLENTIKSISEDLELSNNAIVQRVLNTPITASCNCHRRIESSNPKEEHNKNEFPQICHHLCTFKTCPNHTTENYGQPCAHLWAQYRNDILLQKLVEDANRSYEIPNNMTTQTPEKVYRRSLAPNEM